VGRARFSPDGARLLLTAGRAARILNATNAETVLPPLAHRSAVSDALWSPDGQSIATAAPDDGVQLWNVTTGESTARLPGSEGVRHMALGPDGKRLATAHNDRTVRLWDLKSRRGLFEPWHASNSIRKIAFAPHGRHFAFSTASADGESEVQVRDAATGALVVQILHRNELNDFEYSRDGRYIVTASEEGTARVWDAVTGAAVSPWLVHTYAIQQANFSPDGMRLVTLGSRGFVRLWNARTGEPLTTFFDFTRNEGDYRAQFSPDGERLLFTTGAQSAWILDLTPEQASLDELKLRALVLSCSRVDPVGGVAPVDNEGLNHAWQQLRALRHQH
jgi:WD40 repeat protein